MQNKLKTAIRFNDFLAYFGPRGVVVMAWWLGAVHAARIRHDQNSFPFLQIIGDASVSKTLLLNYLQKLTGQTPYAYSLAQSTPAARARVAGNSGQRVIICEQEGESDERIDWDELKPLYNEGKFVVRPGDSQAELRPFQGALTITGNQPLQCSDAVTSRMVTVNFSDDGPHAIRVSPKALNDLNGEKAIAFGIKVDQSEEWVSSNLETLLPRYQAQLIHKYGHGLSLRTAKNCAQMLALIDLLCTLLSISEGLRLEVRKVIHDIAFNDTIPY
ncbi:hypothetical protein [Pseudomonas mucidolens]|uniref:Uncharacterized protein n=1 Tax=Pseudomonas mucidolens TaxID=46679 RepID=A0A1H2M5Q8_9PSED|nr:hypothetical protein [Pseudomonas mucidolens]SDU87826.1 hypothetical protein SAMN05216202_0971 [Pseudomonas mucidolens]SQH34605.1 Toprim domain-containing protein [Pseudomonas mucidolens]